MTTPTQQQFIADICPAAKKVAEESGTSLELILAQTTQETGQGQETLGGTNNLFNVEADAQWHGRTEEFTVPEYDENKKMYMSKENFRVCDSYEDSLRDRQKFLEDQPPYAKAGLFKKGNLEKEAAAFEKPDMRPDLYVLTEHGRNFKDSHRMAKQSDRCELMHLPNMGGAGQSGMVRSSALTNYRPSQTRAFAALIRSLRAQRYQFVLSCRTRRHLPWPADGWRNLSALNNEEFGDGGPVKHHAYQRG